MTTLLVGNRGVGSQERHHLLKDEQCDDLGELGKSPANPTCGDRDCQKKHGVVCRILTALHLKHRTVDRQNLLSESQELFPEAEVKRKETKPKKSKKNKNYERHVDDDDECEAVREKPPKRKLSFKKDKKKIGKSQSFSSNNNSNKISSSKYEPLGSRDDLNCSCEILVQLSEQHEEKIYGPTTITEKSEISAHIHVYSDVNFGERCLNEKDNSPLVDKTETIDRTTGQYIKHKWNGKRAKKARKRIRRAARTTWISLQTSLNINNMIPTANSFATAFSREDGR